MSSLFVGFIRHSAGFFPTGNHPKTLGNATRGRRSCARHWHRQTSPSPVIVRHRSHRAYHGSAARGGGDAVHAQCAPATESRLVRGSCLKSTDLLTIPLGGIIIHIIQNNRAQQFSFWVRPAV